MPLNRNDFPVYPTSATNVNITGPGTWVLYAPAAGIATLPSSNSIAVTQDLPIYRIAVAPQSGPVTITRSNTDTIAMGGSTTATSFVLAPGESVDMIFNGLTWIALFGATAPVSFRRVKAVSAATQTLDRSASMWSFTGSAATTWTLPALAGNSGLEYLIKNKGSADITLQRAGADNLYATAVVTSITVAAGSSARIVNDGTHWSVL